MKKINNKGFTLVELLAVIVVLAIVMGLAVVGISSVLDNTRKSAFASDAKSYIEGARQLVASDEANVMMGGTSTYTPKCTSTSTGQTKDITIDKIILTSGGKSPFTSSEYSATSKVQVKGDWQSAGYCKYSYSIFLTDGTWAIEGNTAGALVAEENVNSAAVKVKK